MSISLLARRLSSSTFFFPQHHHLALLTPLLRLSLSTKSQPRQELPSLAEFLVTSVGFSPDQALKISNSKSFPKSSDTPKSVVKFLRDNGLSDTQIKVAISRYPRILTSNVDKSLKPNLLELMDRGFSKELLAEVIQYAPSGIGSTEAPSRIVFWRDFFSNDDQVLLKFFKRNSYALTFDSDKKILPKLNLLKEYGISNQDIVMMVRSGHSCLSRSIDKLRQFIDLIEHMGLQPRSRMFFVGFRALGNYSIDSMKKKFEFFKTTFGWSEEDVRTAFRKCPNIFQYSDEKIIQAMDFLTREVKLHPSSIALVPNLLGYNLKKRLIPRHRVISILIAKKIKKKSSLTTACIYSEENFLKKYVEPYKKDAPELSDAYFTA